MADEPLRVYLSSVTARREELWGYRSEILEMGYRCSSSWLVRLPDPSSESTEDRAIRDALDVLTSDVFVAFSQDDFEHKGHGGRHVELGLAMGIQIPVILVGKAENIFHSIYSESKQTAPDWEGAKVLLNSRPPREHAEHWRKNRYRGWDAED